MKRRLGVDDERGVVFVLLALMIVAVAMLVALVVDIGQLRSDRRTDKAAADAAARAGIARLPYGPWSGVCVARKYVTDGVLGFTTFDAGSETWSNASVPPVFSGTNPCGNNLTPDTTPCSPNTPSTWARLNATAAGGRFKIEIQSGYAMPDARFADDVGRLDGGDPAQGSCDNLSVIITQQRATFFAPVGGFFSGTTRVRSVGRLNAAETLEFVAALQLLELHKCGVLQTGGNNTRVIAQPFGTYPGTIQIDSADDSGSCPQPLINGQATSGGPSILACSPVSSNTDCTPGTGNRTSRIGVYALNFNRPAGEISSGYPSTYGDTAAIASPQTGRKYADKRYRANVAALDAQVKGIIGGNSGNPPGCPSSGSYNSCTGAGLTWVVARQADCNNLTNFFATAGRLTAQNIWFNCDLNVNVPVALTAANSYVVVTGQLQVGNAFTISDPRKVYIGGQSTGPKVGVDLTGGTFSVNQASASSCAQRTGAGHSTKLVVGNGSLKVSSGATIHFCQTFVEMASGYDKVPATDGTPPCQSATCTGYTGTVVISSGSSVDWSAPNEITDRLPEANELATTNQFEDLALWTEAGGNTNSITGNGSTNMAGSFFMPNADAFNLAGGGSLPVYLSAQFIATTMKVTGGATVNLVPNPLDSIPTSVYRVLLVR